LHFKHIERTKNITFQERKKKKQKLKYVI